MKLWPCGVVQIGEVDEFEDPALEWTLFAPTGGKSIDFKQARLPVLTRYQSDRSQIWLIGGSLESRSTSIHIMDGHHNLDPRHGWSS